MQSKEEKSFVNETVKVKDDFLWSSVNVPFFSRKSFIECSN